jgi:GNAT superfamily N-acetyltransferase
MMIEVDFYANDHGLRSSADWYVHLWVARFADEVAGYLSADAGGEIDFVVVDKPFQGCGLARRLVELVREHLARQGRVLSHGYPVSPRGRELMARLDVPARPLRPHQVKRTQLDWTDEEATAQGEKFLSAIRGDGSQAVTVLPTHAAVVTWEVDCLPGDGGQPAD